MILLIIFNPEFLSREIKTNKINDMIKFFIPELVTNNIQETISFYTNSLGMELISSFPKENPTWIKLGLNGNYLMFETTDSLSEVIPIIKQTPIGGSFNIYFEADNIEDLFAMLKNSTEIITPLIDKPFKQFSIKDNNGYILLIGQHT